MAKVTHATKRKKTSGRRGKRIPVLPIPEPAAARDEWYRRAAATLTIGIR